jgi:hypothetical protein
MPRSPIDRRQKSLNRCGANKGGARLCGSRGSARPCPGTERRPKRAQKSVRYWTATSGCHTSVWQCGSAGRPEWTKKGGNQRINPPQTQKRSNGNQRINPTQSDLGSAADWRAPSCVLAATGGPRGRGNDAAVQGRLRPGPRVTAHPQTQKRSNGNQRINPTQSDPTRSLRSMVSCEGTKPFRKIAKRRSGATSSALRPQMVSDRP